MPERFRAIHYDPLSESVCGWFVVDPVSGMLVQYREVLARHAGPGQFGRSITQSSAGESYSRTVCNGEVFAGPATEPRACDDLDAAGVYGLEEAPGDLAARQARLRDYTTVYTLQTSGGEAETALLRIQAGCRECLSVWERAPVDDDPRCLMLGYAVMCRPAGEARVVDPLKRRLELEERETRERERQRGADDGRPPKKKRRGW